MEVATVATTKDQEKWLRLPVQIVAVRPRFPLNQMDLGLYTARIASKSTGPPGRQDDIRTIWLLHLIGCFSRIAIIAEA